MSKSIDFSTLNVVFFFELCYEKLKRIGGGKETVMLMLDEDKMYDFKTEKGDAEKITELVNKYNKFSIEKNKQQKYYEGITTGVVEIYPGGPKKGQRIQVGRQDTEITDGKKGVVGNYHHSNQGEMASYHSLGGPLKYSKRNPSKSTRRKGQLLPFAADLISNNEQLLNQIMSMLNGDFDSTSLSDLNLDDPNAVSEYKSQMLDLVASVCSQSSSFFAELINKFNHGRYDPDAIPTSVVGLMDQMRQLPDALKKMAFLDDGESSDVFMNSADQMLRAFGDLLNSVKPNDGKQFHETKNQLRKAAIDVSSAMTKFMNNIEPVWQDAKTSQIVNLAWKVAQSSQELSKKVNSILLEEGKLTASQTKLVGNVFEIANSGANLYAIAQITTRSLHDYSCQKQLQDAIANIVKFLPILSNNDEWSTDEEFEAIRIRSEKLQQAITALSEYLRVNFLGIGLKLMPK